MGENPSTDRHTLRVVRQLGAGRAAVFQAWTDPSILRQWFSPEDCSTSMAEVDLPVGGQYRIGMRTSEGNLRIVTGVYQEIVDPVRLVFTWSWEGGDTQDTLVTVELIDRGEATELILTHERFRSEESRDQHGQGWTGCLAGLARLYTNG